jgi:hypothetical protein
VWTAIVGSALVPASSIRLRLVMSNVARPSVRVAYAIKFEPLQR